MVKKKDILMSDGFKLMILHGFSRETPVYFNDPEKKMPIKVTYDPTCPFNLRLTFPGKDEFSTPFVKNKDNGRYIPEELPPNNNKSDK